MSDTEALIEKSRQESLAESTKALEELVSSAKNRVDGFHLLASDWLNRFFSSVERPKAFLELSSHLDDDQFWRLFHIEWKNFDKIDHLKFEELLGQRRDSWEKGYLLKEDLKFYESLPRELKIYRGQDADDLVGLSWTMDKDTAIHFAKGHSGLLNASPFLIEGIVAKSDIVGAYTGRGLNEIVIFDFSSDVDILVSDLLDS